MNTFLRYFMLSLIPAAPIPNFVFAAVLLANRESVGDLIAAGLFFLMGAGFLLMAMLRMASLQAESDRLALRGESYGDYQRFLRSFR